MTTPDPKRSQPTPDPIPPDLESDLPEEDRKALDDFNWAWNARCQEAIEKLHAGKAAEAVVIARDAVRISESDPNHTELPISLDLLATALMAVGQWLDADETLQKLTQKGFELFGGRHPVMGVWYALSGEVCVHQQHGARAEVILRGALRTLSRSLAHDPIVFDSLGTHESRVLALSMSPLSHESSGFDATIEYPEWPTHPAAMRPLVALAAALCQQERYLESIHYCTAVIKDVESLQSLGWGDDDGASYWREKAQKIKQAAEQRTMNDSTK